MPLCTLRPFSCNSNAALTGVDMATKKQDALPEQRERDLCPENQPDAKRCGIIMPIAGGADPYTKLHWESVKNILEEAITDAGFTPSPVWKSPETNFILKSIVQNIYDFPICVCDLSALNPNVMFELGLRLAFGKPTVLVKDESTKFCFDISILEHIEYKIDLQYKGIVQFKNELSKKIKATCGKYTNGSSTFFLDHFTRIEPKSLKTESVDSNVFTESMLKNILEIVENISSRIGRGTIDNEQSVENSKNIYSTWAQTLKAIQQAEEFKTFCLQNSFDFSKKQIKSPYVKHLFKSQDDEATKKSPSRTDPASTFPKKPSH